MNYLIKSGLALFFTPLLSACSPIDYSASYKYEQINLENQLFTAVKSNNIQNVFNFLEQGANVFIRNEYGQTILHVLAQQSVLTEQLKEILELLLSNIIQKKVFINSLDYQHQTPLLLAVIYRNYDFAKFLIEHGACVDIPDDRGNKPIHFTLWLGSSLLESDIEMILILAKHTKTIDAPCKTLDSCTALHLAVKHRCFTSVENLLLRRANFIQESKQNILGIKNVKETPFYLVFDRCDKEMLQLFLYHMPEDFWSSKCFKHSIALAKEMGRAHFAEYIAKYKERKKTLFQAIETNDIVQFKNSMQEITLKLKDSNGNTPLHKAFMLKRLNFIYFILKIVPQLLWEKNNDGYRSLCYMDYYSKDVVKALLSLPNNLSDSM